MIIEPIMMNAGIIEPEPGFLDALKDLLHSRGALLTFDEVKTGLTAGLQRRHRADRRDAGHHVPGQGHRRRRGHRRGRRVRAEVMAHVADNGYEMVGTFNGNPLAVAACRAMLTEVATPEAYQRIDALRQRAVSGIEREIARTGLQAHVVAVGAKGCVVFSPEPVRNYRGFLGIDDRYSHAHWLFQHNGGVFLPPWGKIEQWLISVQHDESDIDLLVANFGAFATAVTS